MKLSKKIYRFGISLILIVFIMNTTFVYASEGKIPKKNILIINSYDPYNPWTQTEEKGIEDGLQLIRGNVNVFHEYMDSKRLHGKDYEVYFTRYIIEKYSNIKIDLVVSTDDYATLYVKKYRSKFLGEKIPVVFSGVNDLSFKEPYFVGVYERVDIKGTVELIKSIHGEKTPVTIVSDKTLTSSNIIESIINDSVWLKENDVKIISDNNVIEFRKKLNLLKNGAILCLIFNEDSAGNTYTYFEGLDLIRNITDLPIYTVWDFYIGHGAIGGSLITKGEMSESLSNLIIRLINGEDYLALESVITKSKNLIDYSLMSRYGINKKQVVGKATIVNEPVTIWSEYYQLMVIIIGLLGIFIIIIFLLTKKINQKNKGYAIISEHKTEVLQVNQKLEKKLKEVQHLIDQMNERNELMIQLILDLKRKVGFSERLPFILHEINAVLSSIRSRIESLQAQNERLERNEANLSSKQQFEELRELLKESTMDCEIHMESAILLVGATKTCYSDLSTGDQRNYKLSGFVEAFWQMVKPTLKKKKVTFVSNIPDDIALFGNPSEFLTLLAILFGNSLRHGYPTKGDVGLKIEIEAYSSKQAIHIIFRDDGEGCSTEKLEMALKKPLEISNLTRNGIGLYQLNKIVTGAMNGQLIISGDIDQGVQVRINIPKAGESNEQ